MTKNRISITEAVDTVMDSIATRRKYVIDDEIARELANDIVQTLKGQCIDDDWQAEIPAELLSWSAAGLATMVASADDRHDIAQRRLAAKLLWSVRTESKMLAQNGKLVLSRMYCRHRRFQRRLRGDMSST